MRPLVSILHSLFLLQFRHTMFQWESNFLASQCPMVVVRAHLASEVLNPASVHPAIVSRVTSSRMRSLMVSGTGFETHQNLNSVLQHLESRSSWPLGWWGWNPPAAWWNWKLARPDSFSDLLGERFGTLRNVRHIGTSQDKIKKYKQSRRRCKWQNIWDLKCCNLGALLVSHKPLQQGLADH